jgi:hypothetical protein
MTSCHVSEKPKSGPVNAQTSTTTTAATNAIGVPTAWETLLANLRKRFARGYMDLNALRIYDFSIPKQMEVGMPRGDKSAYTDKQKRRAEHIAESYEKRGVSAKTAKARAWATVNKESGAAGVAREQLIARRTCFRPSPPTGPA